MYPERFCDPYLVKSRLARAFVSCTVPDYLLKELEDMGVKYYVLGKSDNMSGELATHPDILLNNYRRGMWLCESNAKYLPPELKPSFFTESETELGDLYPFDCPFNNFRVKNTLYCGKGVDYIIRSFANYEDMRIVYLKQNYVKCCCVIVNDHAIITSDALIARELRRNDFDVLQIEDTKEIYLKGYSHGLIGGCAVKISDALIGFTGDLNQYSQGDIIRDFCANYGVDAYSLSNKPMYDYGGILPITEYIPKDKQATVPDCSFAANYERPESERPRPANLRFNRSRKRLP